jgi:hypothetical protein
MIETELAPMVRDVTTSEGGYLAVGDAWDASTGMFGPGAWTSRDGRSWQSMDITVQMPPGRVPDVLYQVEAIGDRLVAAMYGQLFVSDGTARSWHYVPLGEAACPTELASNGDRVVAVGHIGACGYGGPSRPAAWVSSDGLSWSPATLDGADVASGGFQGVLEIPGGFLGWGYFSAHEFAGTTGSTPYPNEPYAGAPWFSADGASWARLPEPGPFADAGIDDIVRGDGVLAALGRIGKDDDTAWALWTSADGRAWGQVTARLPIDGSFTQIPRPVVSMNLDIGGGPIGVALWSVDWESGTRVWVSHDGVNWVGVDSLPQYAYMSDVFDMDGWLLAVGTREVADPGVSLPCTKWDVVSGACRIVGTFWTSGL